MDNNKKNILLTAQCQSCPPCQSNAKTIVSFLWSMFTIFAIYLSFKCNNGFDFGGFLAACCCSPLYVAYKLAVGNCFASATAITIEPILND
jgi:hypothetical protein